MKRFLLLLGGCAALLLPARPAAATDFSLRPRDPGPGHRLPTYWWNFNHALWELVPPEKYSLTGGGELRLEKADSPGLAAICRESTRGERDLLGKKDAAAEDAYCRSLLPTGIKDLTLVSQQENPLPVNGLTNFEAVYRYNLGGAVFRAIYLVSRGSGDPIQGQPRPAGSSATPPPGKLEGEYFTAAVVAPDDRADELFQAFEQLMATARVKNAESSEDGQYVSHGMLGR